MLGEDACRAAGSLVGEDDEQVTAPLARLYTVPHDRTPGSDCVNGVAQPAR
jgi:hypothetical protein